MATLILNAAGQYFGGVVGGAIGALVGQAVDARIFAPKPTHGPRLKDLAVQTSQYGTAIPALFGRMRVAGTVIWSTDLIESRTKTGNGKGRPATIQYSYRASFAVALSSRPAMRLGRIWADGKLLRAEGGGLSGGGVLRFYMGAGDQMPDPLIAADVGAAQCPAYRGLAYAVLEDLPLADFGNRIPSLTFEVIADEGSISLDTIARYATDGRLTAPDSTPLIGYVAEGADVDAWLAPLVAAEGRVLAQAGVSGGGGFALVQPTTAPIPVPDDHVVTLNGARQEAGGASLPSTSNAQPPMRLRYYDAARDYQIAVQASLSGDHALPVDSVDLPAVMSADAAASLIHRIAHARRAAAQGEERIVPEEWAEALPIGALYTVAGQARVWQVAEREWLNGAVRLTARAYTAAPPIALTGSSGAHIGSVVADTGQTRLLAVELPAIAGLSTTALLTAAGTEPGWRGAMTNAQVDGMAQPLGWIGRGAVMGESATALPAHHGLLSSPDTVLEVEWLHADMDVPPPNASNPPLLWLAGEIVGYADAVPVSATRWRLSGLTRGLYNSGVTAAHPVGSPVLLLDEAMPHWPLTVSDPVDTVLVFSAEGVNDDPPAMASLLVQHKVTRPPAPVHARYWRDGGSLHLAWARRSRLPTMWQDYIDAPLGEAVERYHIASGDRVWETNEPRLTVPLSALGPSGAAALSIRHIGDGGASDPLTLFIPASALA